MSDPVPNQLSGEATPNVSAAGTPPPGSTGGAPAPGTPAAAPGASGTPVGWTPGPAPAPTPAAASGGGARSGILALVLSPIGIRLLIGAVILVGGLLVRDFVTRDVDDINVGDCIDVPTNLSQDFSELQHHPCDQAHTGEVISVFNYTPGGSSEPYPGIPAFEAQVARTCLPAFATYTGTSFEDRADLDLTWFHPTETSWSKGDRELVCVAVNIDGSTMKASIKKR